MKPASRPTPQHRAVWTKRLMALADDARRADEALLIGIHDAVEAGMVQADIAYAIGDKSPTGIKAKADKGAALLEAKKR